MKSTRTAMALSILLLSAASLLAEAPKTLPPAPSHDATTAAKKKVQESGAALAKANGAFGRITDTLHKTLESTPEWAEANAALNTARANYEAARAAVVDKLPSSSSLYASTLQAKKESEAQKDAILKDSASTPQQRMDAANAVMKAGKQVTSIEADACAADPKFVEAKKQLADASAKVQKLNNDFEATVKEKPEWQAAKQEVQTASDDLKKSKEELAGAQQADAQADAAWRAQVATMSKPAAAQGSYKKK
jgi:chromosome segregation ATPase